MNLKLVVLLAFLIVACSARRLHDRNKQKPSKENKRDRDREAPETNVAHKTDEPSAPAEAIVDRTGRLFDLTTFDNSRYDVPLGKLQPVPPYSERFAIPSSSYANYYSNGYRPVPPYDYNPYHLNYYNPYTYSGYVPF